MKFIKTKIFLFVFSSIFLTSFAFTYTNDGVYAIYSDHYKTVADKKFNQIGDYATYYGRDDSVKEKLASKWSNNDDGYVRFNIWGENQITNLSISESDIIEGDNTKGLYLMNAQFAYIYFGHVEEQNKSEYDYFVKNNKFSGTFHQFIDTRKKNLSEFKYIMFNLRLKPTDIIHFGVLRMTSAVGLYGIGETRIESVTPDMHAITTGDYGYGSFMNPQMEKKSDTLAWYTIIITTTQIAGKGYVADLLDKYKFDDIQGFYFQPQESDVSFYLDNFVLFKDMPKEIKISTTNITIPTNTAKLLFADAYDRFERLSAMNPPKWECNTGKLAYTKNVYENYFSTGTVGSYTVTVSNSVYTDPENEVYTLTPLPSTTAKITVADIAWKSQFNIWTDSVKTGTINKFTNQTDNAGATISTIDKETDGAKILKFAYTIQSGGGYSGIYIGEATKNDLSFCDVSNSILYFKIKLTTNRDLFVGIKSDGMLDDNNAKIKLSELGVNLASTDWQEVRVLLDNFKLKEPTVDFSKMLNYIILSDESSSSSITNEFQIDDIKWLSPKVEKPSITHTAITSLVKGQSLQLKANISVNNYIPTVYLHYKLNSSAWSKVEMPVTLVSPNLYSAVYNLSSDYFNQVTDKANSFSYCIEVVDSTNESLAYWNDKNESTPQQFNIQLVDTPKEEIIGSNGATLIKTDNATNIDLVTLIVPQGALNTNTSITITKKNITDIAQLDSRNATVAYQFSPALNFNKPVTLVLSYPNTANDGLVDNLEEGYNDATKLRVYYLNEQNDNKWDLVGGLVNTSNKTITFQTNHFSTYAVFYTDLNKESYKPKYRIFTPNGDGVNDKVIFPNLDDVNVEIKILDVNAKKVRDIKQRPYEWDGKDNFGNIVESGTYIYQFKIKIKDKDEYINGTLALAK